MRGERERGRSGRRGEGRGERGERGRGERGERGEEGYRMKEDLLFQIFIYILLIRLWLTITLAYKLQPCLIKIKQ